MKNKKLSPGELKLAEIIWRKEPVSSGELVRLCEKEFEWKKSTTYTVLKKLEAYGMIRNDSSTVHSCITKDEYLCRQSRSFIEDSFGGSLPKFLTAFMSGEKLTATQAEELKKLIDRCQ